MYCSRFVLLCGILLSLHSLSANGQAGYVLGASAEIDTEDGRAVAVFADYGFSDSTWLSGTVARTNTGGVLGGLNTIYVDAALEHSFGVAGIRAGAAYWGDDDILDSNDARGSLFFRGKKASLTIDYERRDFDFVFTPLLEPGRIRTAEFSADGIGASGWVKPGENTTLFVGGMSYDYSQDIRIQPRIDTLLFLSSSRLSLINSLIDHRISGGIEFSFDRNSLDFTIGRWQTAIDGGSVNSFSIGFVAPSGLASELEFRLAFDDAENFGSTVAFAITYFYFGV